MDGVVTAARGSMSVAYHQFWLFDAGRHAQPSIRVSNGLIGVGTGAAVIYTGIHTGEVALSVEGRDRAPEDVDVTGWDEVVEVSLAAPSGRVRPAPLMTPSDPFPELTVAGPGEYRVRVHARGRDANVDGVDFEPVEQYRVVVWPHAAEPERIHRQSDGYGASVRRGFAKAPPVPERPVDERQARIDEVLRQVQERYRPEGH